MPDFIHVLVRFYINFSSPSGYISDNLLAQFYPKKMLKAYNTKQYKYHTMKIMFQ